MDTSDDEFEAGPERLTVSAINRLCARIRKSDALSERSSPGTWCNSASSSRLIDQLAISNAGATSSRLMASIAAIDSGLK